MNITTFGELLAAARAQSQPQRILFAFARAEAPDEQGRGVSLQPVMCVDKTPDELGSFADLVAESRHTGADWDVVFVTTMSGSGGKAPTTAAAEAPLNMMVTYIHTGQVERFLAFDKSGELLAIKNQ
jgi:hypothetical protein